MEYKIDGLEALRAKLVNLPSKIQRTVLKEAVKEAGQVVERAAKEKAPVASKNIYRAAIHKKGKKAGQNYQKRLVPGTLKKSIGIRMKRKGVTKDSVVYLVGPSKKAFYGQFVEKGHVLRKRRKGPIIGTVKPYPFLKPALEQNVQAAIDTMKRKIESALPSLVGG